MNEDSNLKNEFNEENNNIVNESNRNIDNKSNKLRNILLIILIVIILIINLFVFIEVNKKNDIGKDNNINEPENNNIDNNINKVNSYTKEQIKNFVYEFPYARVTEEYSYEELWLGYKISTTLDSLKIDLKEQENKWSLNLKKEKDKNGKVYSEYEEYSPQYFGKMLGLNVDEINNIDLGKWKEFFAGNTYFYIVDGKTFREQYNKLFGSDEVFNDSFIINKPFLTVQQSIDYLYDSKIDKVIMHNSGGVAGQMRTVEIINEEETENEYIIHFVEGLFSTNYDGTYKLNDMSVKVNSEDLEGELRKFLSKNSDKLRVYKVVFKKINDGYVYSNVI